MQEDMHYYGTYAIALAAGIPEQEAEIIAYASQYVDDATSTRNGEHDDGGLMVTFSTAHHWLQCLKTTIKFDSDTQRKVWVPNHFVPGGAGNSFEEKALCLPDSVIAQKMFDEHIVFAKHRLDAYGLELMGIVSHAYRQTTKRPN